MSYASSLADDSSPLIFDTSVLINLHASRYGRRILTALPNDALVPEIVARELAHETSRTNGEHQFILELAASANVKLVSLNDRENEIFATLVSGSRSLDDGEAATIAVAACRNHRPVIDERKGRLRAQDYCAGRLPGWSLDIFLHPQIVTTLSATGTVDALYLALRNGRMRIDEVHCDHVVDLIGRRRALECSSLPGYKVRREQWAKEILPTPEIERS